MIRSFSLAAALTVLLIACASPRPAADMPQEVPEDARTEAPTDRPVEVTDGAQAVSTPEVAPPAGLDPDTVEAGRFDNGRMFTLDQPPLEYFREEYGFAPEHSWFDRARLGALRFASYCSASFVSPNGLILTNHHCARQSVTQASLEDGVDYNAEGYYAGAVEEEKPIEGLFVEQLIDITDVTSEVEASLAGLSDAAARQEARATITDSLETTLTEQAGEGFRTQIVSFYAGAQVKAYTYKRYDNVRLVFAPETKMGYFGGDPDNFTYPRYSLDFALFRAVDEDGSPIEPEVYFPFEAEGTEPGDLVFVVGNPGSTSRLQTVAELLFRRDVTEPAALSYLASREAVFGEFVKANPEDPRTPELKDTYFSLGNSRKAYTGRVEGLRDPYVIARRRDAEEDFQDALAEMPDAQAEYGDVIEALAANRERLREAAPLIRATVGFGPGAPLNGALVNRAFTIALSEGEVSEEDVLAIEDEPISIQEGLLAARLRDFHNYLGDDDEVVQQILQGRTPEHAAAEIIDGSQLVTTEQVQQALNSEASLMEDPAVQMVQTLLPLLQKVGPVQQQAATEASELRTRLARARFEVYGTKVPPDATFTLRISDGEVKNYPYNGTETSPYTTFFGMYDRFFGHCVYGRAEAGQGEDECSWTLPERWLEARDRLDLATPYNFVSTNDIIGGNSGSPVLNRDLEVVGIAFDGNIQSLPGDYIFDDTLNRTVSVDVRAMIESLGTVYNLDWLVDEVTSDM